MSHVQEPEQMEVREQDPLAALSAVREEARVALKAVFSGEERQRLPRSREVQSQYIKAVEALRRAEAESRISSRTGSYFLELMTGLLLNQMLAEHLVVGHKGRGKTRSLRGLLETLQRSLEHQG
jgi:hypothetical protein